MCWVSYFFFFLRNFKNTVHYVIFSLSSQRLIVIINEKQMNKFHCAFLSRLSLICHFLLFLLFCVKYHYFVFFLRKLQRSSSLCCFLPKQSTCHFLLKTIKFNHFIWFSVEYYIIVFLSGKLQRSSSICCFLPKQSTFYYYY